RATTGSSASRGGADAEALKACDPLRRPRVEGRSRDPTNCRRARWREVIMGARHFSSEYPMPDRVELANAMRALAMDAVQQANSGHPGMPMGMAEIAEVLWN